MFFYPNQTLEPMLTPNVFFFFIVMQLCVIDASRKKVDARWDRFAK
jgi:hypothetical protein